MPRAPRRPGLIAQPAPQQHLAQSMPGAREILADILARPNQIAQRLLGLSRDANERQAARRELANQALGIPARRS